MPTWFGVNRKKTGGDSMIRNHSPRNRTARCIWHGNLEKVLDNKVDISTIGGSHVIKWFCSRTAATFGDFLCLLIFEVINGSCESKLEINTFGMVGDRQLLNSHGLFYKASRRKTNIFTVKCGRCVHITVRHGRFQFPSNRSGKGNKLAYL